MRELRRWGVGLALGAMLAAVLPAQASEGVALGLIVRLKDAPAHDRAQAQAIGGGRTQADAEVDRMHGVLAAAGLAARRVRPVGRDAQVVDFGRSLNGAQAEALAAQLRLRPDVAWVEANTREQLLELRTPTDPLFARTSTQPGQWWMFSNTGAGAVSLADRRQGVPNLQAAWATSTGSAAAVVAVLDTGITSHVDLAGRVLPGYDFVSDVAVANDGNGRDADPSDPGDWVSASEVANDPAFDLCDVADSTWHGTRIAGMLAARTNSGGFGAGIQWNGRVLPVRVAGKCGASVADIVDGMRWAAGLHVVGVPDNPNPARIINISFGGDAECGSAYAAAVADLKAVGAIVVAAAGNFASAPSRPANCAGVVGVVALNRDGFKAYYSNFGAALSATGVATVGGDPSSGEAGDELADEGLLTLDNTGLRGPDAAGSAYVAGTSFSAPIAAGVAALMLSVNPDLSAQQLIDGLRVTSRPHVDGGRFAACTAGNNARCDCSTATCGAGILDADAAVRHAQSIVGDGSGGGTTGGGGGGALSLAWLLGLALAVAALSCPAGWRRARSPGPAPRT